MHSLISDTILVIHFAFVVIAQNPNDLQAHYKVQALGPWTGKLNNSGETLTLRDAKGEKIDEVDYKEGFP